MWSWHSNLRFLCPRTPWQQSFAASARNQVFRLAAHSAQRNHLQKSTVKNFSRGSCTDGLRLIGVPISESGYTGYEFSIGPDHGQVGQISRVRQLSWNGLVLLPAPHLVRGSRRTSNNLRASQPGGGGNQ